MRNIKVMTVFGTRPEAIKMAPVVKELENNSDRFDSVVVVTAQHREMLDQVLDKFEITPDHDLNLMKKNQTLASITVDALDKLFDVMKDEQPDIVLVHGDTTTTFAAAMAAFYNMIPVGHVEAGLRTYDKYSPFPEEINRQVTTVIADMHFAPTEQSRQNLLLERKENIFVTGNTAIDALKWTVTKDYAHPLLELIGDDRFVLITAHRRENLGEPMRNIFRAIRRLAETHKDTQFVFPVHLNPKVQELASEILGGLEGVHLIEPLNVFDFHNLAARSTLILSDSGGVQEEAPSLGVPVLVLRDTTERPEGIAAGTLKLVGTDEETIFSVSDELLTNESERLKMARASNPYGDGKAALRILYAIQNHIEVS